MLRLDTSTWVAAPRQLSAGPVLCAVDGFLTEAEAAAVLARFGDEAWVQANADHYGWNDAGFCAEVPAESAPELDELAQRIDALTGVRSAARRTLRFRYYNEGEGHPAHTDTYGDGDLVLGATALLGLMDTDAGGETRFPAATPEPVEVAPRLGRLVWWNSTGPGGEDDPRSLHEGARVHAGAKAVLLSFAYLPAERHPALPPLEEPCPTAS